MGSSGAGGGQVHHASAHVFDENQVDCKEGEQNEHNTSADPQQPHLVGMGKLVDIH